MLRVSGLSPHTCRRRFRPREPGPAVAQAASTAEPEPLPGAVSTTELATGPANVGPSVAATGGAAADFGRQRRLRHHRRFGRRCRRRRCGSGCGRWPLFGRCRNPRCASRFALHLFASLPQISVVAVHSESLAESEGFCNKLVRRTNVGERLPASQARRPSGWRRLAMALPNNRTGNGSSSVDAALLVFLTGVCNDRLGCRVRAALGNWGLQ